MDRIILIETSTSLCSTALVEDGSVVEYLESAEPRQQAALTAPFVQKMLAKRSLAVKDCSAVCVSSGPGSYTGLRVGISTAKGLCFGSKLPLISVDTLELLVWQAIMDNLIPQGCKYIIPMIDARRMEVYTAIFNTTGERLSEIAPIVINSESFAEYLNQGTTLVIGDGAEKCKGALSGADIHFVQCCPRADALCIPALRKYKEKRFEDTAYFEPFYLKQFVATTSNKKLF